MSYERCYLGTPTTCDAFVAEGLISQQPQQMLLGQLPGAPVPQAPAALPLAATLEVTREGWVPRPLSVERHTCCTGVVYVIKSPSTGEAAPQRSPTPG